VDANIGKELPDEPEHAEVLNDDGVDPCRPGRIDEVEGRLKLRG